ncbi:efflux RND transporter periplasmic adaptor subunit [Thiohalocapsa sp.]|uniref:efflux RND transporter periplasmic adaptor subunit n=1 Tax=Thiohalocapsa sp. TaxID=2497641 RepID=UPI0025E99306|nr:efflux RND transporter periplasmic adaptor subunit [Thiohalocapsa sp.]
MLLDPMIDRFVTQTPRRAALVPARGTLLAVSLALATAAGADELPEAPSTVQPAIAVPVLPAQLEDGYDSALTFTGQVEARRLSRVGFEQAGLLAQVLVREGDAVKAGAVLARLDRASLLARRAELTAARASAEADLALAEATAARFRDSVKDGAVTRQALDEAVEGARAAAANVRLAEARIATVDVDLAKADLRAPYAGVITARLADEGQVLGAGTPVLELQDGAPPDIRIGVAGRLAGRLVPGEVYTLELRDGDLRARLRAVLPRRAATSRTVDALFEPVETGALPRPGELVSLKLHEHRAAAGLWLPISALSAGERGLWRALVAVPSDAAAAQEPTAPSHRLEARPVQVLVLDGERAYVAGAIEPGEPVVTAGLHRVVAGQFVRVTAAPERQLAIEAR